MIAMRQLTDELPTPTPRPDAPVRLSLTAGTVESTQQELARLSEGQREALVIWAGRATSVGALITHLITVDTVADRYSLTVPSPARAELALALRERRLLAFADLHTHPTHAFLSEADRAHPFSSRRGFYAIVLPDFAVGVPGVGWRAYESTGTDWQEVNCHDRFSPWPQ